MPNHVRNIISFDCSEERLREILEAIQYDKSDSHEEAGIGTLDFNKIIPMPKSLEIEAGSSTDRGLKAYNDCSICPCIYGQYRVACRTESESQNSG